MQHLEMITVTDDCLPLAGSGHNTIRKFAGKYMGLQVGDAVVMHYTDNPQTTGVAAATELLKVSATAIAPLETLVQHHGHMNHGLEASDLNKLKNDIRGFYPSEVDGEELNDDELYIAIYF